jgi:hypothetical protein
MAVSVISTRLLEIISKRSDEADAIVSNCRGAAGRRHRARGHAPAAMAEAAGTARAERAGSLPPFSCPLLPARGHPSRRNDRSTRNSRLGQAPSDVN